jgi:RsiW-degrading membrane proteinase PrsW (M82 family)
MTFFLYLIVSLPLLILLLLLGRARKRAFLYALWGFIAAVPVLILFPLLSPLVPHPDITVSPLLEEFFKGLPVIVPVLLGIRYRGREVLMYSMASGIGFSVIENWGYIDPTWEAITPGIAILFLARAYSTALMHGCTSGIIGYGASLISDFNRRAIPALIFGFFTIAVTIHASFNLYERYGGDLGDIVAGLISMLLFLILMICYQVDIIGLVKMGLSGQADDRKESD